MSSTSTHPVSRIRLSGTSAAAVAVVTAVISALVATGCSSSPGGMMSMGGTGGMTGGPGTGGAAPITSCTPGVMQLNGTLQGRYGSLDSQAIDNSPIGHHEYYLQVNQWNTAAAGTQTMTYGNGSYFTMTVQTASAATTGGPTGFPSLFTGANSNHATSDSNLPKLVSALTYVPTSWTWNDAGTLADTANNSYDAVYDVWFSTSAAGDPTASAPSGGFLMVWFHRPQDAQPIGSVMYSGVTIPNVSGTWNIWIGPNNGKPVISYVRTADALSLSFDLNDFIKDAVSNRIYNGAPPIQSSWYLSNIFSGFEIWRGGVNLQSTSFCAIVN